jgi:hypothetical protein
VLRYELQGVLGEGLGGSDGTGSGWSMELTEGLQWLRRSVLARGEGGMGFKGESAVGKGFVRAKEKAKSRHGQVRQGGAATCGGRGSQRRMAVRRPMGGRTSCCADHGPALRHA